MLPETENKDNKNSLTHLLNQQEQKENTTFIMFAYESTTYKK